MTQAPEYTSDSIDVPLEAEPFVGVAENIVMSEVPATGSSYRTPRLAPLGALWPRETDALWQEGQLGTLRGATQYSDSCENRGLAEHQESELIRYLRLG